MYNVQIHVSINKYGPTNATKIKPTKITSLFTRGITIEHCNNMN